MAKSACGSKVEVYNMRIMTSSLYIAYQVLLPNHCVYLDLRFDLTSGILLSFCIFFSSCLACVCLSLADEIHSLLCAVI